MFRKKKVVSLLLLSISYVVLGYFLFFVFFFFFGLESRFPETSGCADSAGSLHPQWPSPLRKGCPRPLPLPLPQSEGLRDLLGSLL